MMRPSHRSTTSNGGGGASNGTILVNLDVFVQRATVGHDISPLDEDLIVLFRRNSKEITSEPTRWHSDHIAEWNQHVGIQTSLLRGKKPVSMHMNPNGTYPNEFLKKEYEVVLVAVWDCRWDSQAFSVWCSPFFLHGCSLCVCAAPKSLGSGVVYRRLC